MANAQVLVLVRAVAGASISDEVVRGIVETAARAAGFTPGPWSSNQQTVRVQSAVGGGGTVAAGPWQGDTVSESIPAGGANLTFYAYRQNLLNGPAPTAEQQASGGWPMATSPVGQALRALAGVSSTRISFRAPGNVISWDRGIPAPIELTATAPARSYGMLWGVLAVAGLAYAASKGTVARTALGKLSTNREGLTFEEWRRAAGVSSSAPGVHVAWVKGEDPTEWRATTRAATVASRTRLMGLSGTPEQHKRQAEYLLQQAKSMSGEDRRFTIARALQEAEWVRPRAEQSRLHRQAAALRAGR